MLETPMVFVDIETNGGNGSRGRIIEVAAIKVENGEIIDTFSSLINPGNDIPYWITKLTGIENNDLLSAPYFEDIADQLYEFLEGSLFVAHNVLFDYSFIKRQFKELGYSFTPKLMCTVRLSRALYDVKGHSLEKIIHRHSIEVSARHRAYDDAKAIYDFVKIAIKDHGIDAVKMNIALQTKTKTLPPNVEEDVISGLPSSPGVYVFEDDSGFPLYIGKSINIRNRVKSHFANATMIAKEMKLSLKSHNVSYIKTDTEIEALLLESSMIKELKPIHNVRLRKTKKQSILIKSVDENGYLKMEIATEDLSTYSKLDNVYGVYKNRKSAKDALELVVRSYQLCPVLMGLEKSSGSCFRYQLKLCQGACINKEDPEEYNKRLELALQYSKIQSWPFKTAIEVKISEHKTMILDQWIIKSIKDYSMDGDEVTIDDTFSIDTYKILKTFMKSKPPYSEYRVA